MEMKLADVGGVKKVTLTRPFGFRGGRVVETQFSASLVPAGQSAIVDLSELSFLASLGVRMFISTTRALSWKGKELVLYGATPTVMEIIETMGFADIVPVVGTKSEALALVSA